MDSKDYYEQLSSDWRHRDQLTWQLPSVLIATSVALVTIVYQESALDVVRFYLLWGGVIFTGLITMALGQNLYFQAVSEDLMAALRSGAVFTGSSIPRRRDPGPSFVKFTLKHLVKAGSTGLFLLSANLTGFLGFVISDLQFQSDTKYKWWVGVGIVVIFLTVLINLLIYTCHKQR